MLRGSKKREGAASGSTRGRSKARAQILQSDPQDAPVKESFENAIKRCGAIYRDTTSEWYGAEILYHVEVRQRPRLQDQMAQVAAKKSSDRHLSLIRKKDPFTQRSTIIFLAQVIIRSGGEVDIKYPFPLSVLKALDSIDDLILNMNGEGEAEHKLVFVFPQLDIALNFDTERERSECTWVLVKVCRQVYGLDISYDYKLDLESVGYAFVTAGQMQRFPLLSKVGIGAVVGDVFAEEELEAEQILSEHLGARSASAASRGVKDDMHYLSTEELLKALDYQNTNLQGEIIDFLLRWEDDDIESVRPSLCLLPAPGGSSAFLDSAGASGTDTVDVLHALVSVDSDLEGVDAWLGDQIDQLNFIQSKLFLIESESGTLETSYSNLTSVQRIVDELITALRLDSEDERYLRAPMALIKSALAAPSLEDVDTLLAPLVTALGNVQSALKRKGVEGGASTAKEMSAHTWEALQSLSGIALQRGKLLELSDTCNAAIAAGSLTLFEGILKHKSLRKKAAGKSGGIITVQNFNLTPVLQANIGAQNSAKNYSVGDDPSKNDALAAQRLLQGSLNDFLPVLEAVLEFSKHQPVGGMYMSMLTLSNDSQPWNQIILDNYVTTTETLFYTPLIKQLFVDLHGIMRARKSLLSMRTIKSYVSTKSSGAGLPRLSIIDQIVAGDKDIQYFNLSRTTVNYQSPGITPWEALELALIIIAPVVSREESFFQSIFHCDAKHVGTDRDATGEIVVNVPDEGRTPAQQSGLGLAESKSAHHLWQVAFQSAKKAGAFRRSSSKRQNYLLSTTETMLNTIFKELPVNIGNLIATTEASFFAGTPTEVDGIEAIAMLVTLQNYMIRIGIPHVPPVVQHLEFNQLGQPIGVGSGVGDLGGISMLPLEEQSAYSAPLPAKDLYLSSLLYRIRSVLLGKVQLFLDENLAWLEKQSPDPKNPGVLLPMTKLPSMLACIFSITSKLLHETTLNCVDEFVFILTREVLKWTFKISDINDKYKDIVLMHNLSYFEHAMAWFVKDQQPVVGGAATAAAATSASTSANGVRYTLEYLEPFIAYVREARKTAEEAYIRWMLAYEFAELASITSRMEGLGERVKMEELALYVRRKDVLTVINGLDARTVEYGISSMRSRNRKHCATSYGEENIYGEQTLLERTWEALGDRMRDVLSRLADAAQASYQIQLLVTPAAVKKMFGKN
jgi:hypothetical protein